MLDRPSRFGKRTSHRYHSVTNRSNVIWCLMSKWGRTSAGRPDFCGRQPYNGDPFNSHLLIRSFQGLSKDNLAGGGIEWPQYHGL